VGREESTPKEGKEWEGEELRRKKADGRFDWSYHYQGSSTTALGKLGREGRMGRSTFEMKSN